MCHIAILCTLNVLPLLWDNPFSTFNSNSSHCHPRNVTYPKLGECIGGWECYFVVIFCVESDSWGCRYRYFWPKLTHWRLRIVVLSEGLRRRRVEMYRIFLASLAFSRIECIALQFPLHKLLRRSLHLAETWRSCKSGRTYKEHPWIHFAGVWSFLCIFQDRMYRTAIPVA